MAANKDNSTSCGAGCLLCLEKGESVVDPRVLPCSHVYCKPCLSGYFDKYGAIHCFLCSKVFDGELDNLPSLNNNAEDSSACDICVKKDNKHRLAVMYCVSCAKKHCAKHQESHDDLLEDHMTVSVEEYKQQAGKLAPRSCAKHRNKTYTLGCRACLEVFCTQCAASGTVCLGGKSHELLDLSELVNALTEKITTMKADIINREKKLSTLFKKTSKVISEYEIETEELVKALGQTRNRQMKALETKYRQLEEELLKSRRATQEKMTEFMEEEVGGQLTDVINQRMKIEARIRHNHQVDIVCEYKKTQKEINQVVDGKLPSLDIDNVKTLANKDKMREAEVEIVSTEEVHISSEDELSARVLPAPMSITFVRSVRTSSFCHSVCHYNGLTFLGTQNCVISFIDSEYNLQNAFLPLGTNSWAYGITLHKNQLYISVSSRSGSINVYDISGQFVNQWNHNDDSHYIRPAITDGQVIVPDKSNSRLALYSLNGKLIKHIVCPQLNGDRYSGAAICSIDETSVVVTNYKSSKVLRVNLQTGKIIWTCEDVNQPHGVAIYEKNHVCVCVISEQRVSFLNIKTGSVISYIIVDAIVSKGGHKMDLSIIDNSLIVSTASGVQFYRLNK